MLPPLLWIVVARRARERFQRIRASRLPFGPFGSELHRLRQIHEPRRNAVRSRPAQRLPFRREDREGIENTASRILRRVDEQRDRRAQLLVAHEAHQLIRVGWPFDEDDIGEERIERGAERTGTPGPVVPDTEDVDPLGHSSTSMQAR